MIAMFHNVPTIILCVLVRLSQQTGIEFASYYSNSTVTFVSNHTIRPTNGISSVSISDQYCRVYYCLAETLRLLMLHLSSYSGKTAAITVCPPFPLPCSSVTKYDR